MNDSLQKTANDSLQKTARRAVSLGTKLVGWGLLLLLGMWIVTASLGSHNLTTGHYGGKGGGSAQLPPGPGDNAPGTNKTSGNNTNNSNASNNNGVTVSGGKGVCGHKVDPATMTINIASITTGISVSDMTQAALGAAIIPFYTTFCSWNDDISNWAKGQSFVFSTGEGITTGNATVTAIWNNFILAADVLLIVALAVTGHSVALGQQRATDALPRIVLALIAVHAAPTFIPLLIKANNGLCDTVVSAAGIKAMTDQANIVDALGGNIDVAAALGASPVLLLAMIFVLAGIAVSLQMLVRIGLLDVLIVLSPLLLCYAVPSWQKVANFWAVAFLGTLFVQAVQVTAIALGSALLATLGGGTVVGVFAGIAILFMLLQIPKYVGNAVTGALGGVQSPYQYAAEAIGQVTEKAMQVGKALAMAA